MNKLYLLALLLIIGSLKLDAQRIVFEGQFLQFSVGSKISTLYDYSVSPIHYQGLSGVTRIGYRNNSPNLQWWGEVDIDAGYYNSFNYPSISDRTANQITGGYDFGFTKPIHEFTNELYLWAGFGVMGRYNYNYFEDYSNSQDNYTFLNSFALNGMLHYTFNMFDRWVSLEWVMKVPLATYYMRPGYSVNFPDDEIGESDLVTFNRYYEIDSELRLVFPFLNENKISLEYHWDYYNLNTSNKVQYGSHGVFITANFKLNYYKK
ncbi:MAG: hypothetical protein ABFR62_07655 [Bacteroidota bacterium]